MSPSSCLYPTSFLFPLFLFPLFLFHYSISKRARKGRLDPSARQDYDNGMANGNDMKAYLVREGSKLAGDLIRYWVKSPPKGITKEPPAAQGAPALEKPPTAAQEKVLTRPGVDAERMAWQDALIRGELWLLEGHLKNKGLGCGGDVECLFKHSTNIIDAARETQSMTTDPLYAETVKLAERIRPLVYPEDVKSGKYRAQYPALVLEVSRVRTQFDARVMRHRKPSRTPNPGITQLPPLSLEQYIDSELAHHTSGAEDGEEAHNSEMTVVGSRVVELVAGRVFDEELKGVTW